MDLYPQGWDALLSFGSAAMTRRKRSPVAGAHSPSYLLAERPRGTAALHMNFTAPDFLKDPSSKLKELRAAGPLVQVRFRIVGKTWISTTQEMTISVLHFNR